MLKVGDSRGVRNWRGAETARLPNQAPSAARRFQTSGTPQENSNSMIRGTSLAILALLAVVVLATGAVFAAPRQQAMDDATLSSLTLSDVTLEAPYTDSGEVGYEGTAANAVTETTITATPTNPNATVVITLDSVEYSNGSVVPLAVGQNRIRLVVTAEDTTTTLRHNITVVRAKYIATRSINPSTVFPGDTFAVTLDFGDYGNLGGLVDEYLPTGFSWVVVLDEPDPPVPGDTTVYLPSNITANTRMDPQNLDLTLLGVATTFTYEVSVADTVPPGLYEITGEIVDEDRDHFPVLGDTEITVVLPPGVAISPTDLTVNEGSTGTYTVKLNAEPSDEVTVTIVDPTDNTDVTASPASLSFSTTDWATAQTVTVSAAEDADSSQDTATVTHTVAGGDYAAITASDVAVTVTDNDTPGVAVSPTSLTVTEGSSTGTYTVELNTLPTGNVTVAISSNNTDVTTSSTRLTFTTSNWNSAQTVTVTAGEDDDAANDMATLTHDPSGADYSSVSSASLTVTVTDDETRGVTVTPTSLLVTEGGSGTYTVVLDTQPTSGVAVAISSDNADVMTNPSRLTFSTSNWSTVQTVTVRTAEDGDPLDDTATVTHTVSGGDYGSVTAAAVGVTVTDNDTPGVSVSPSSLTIGENSTETYTVKLDTQPTGDVTVNIGSSGTVFVSVSPSSLTFTTSNWNSARTVTVRAPEDDDATDGTATLTHTASGADYGSVSNASVTVTVNDNDTAGVTVTPTSLPINEGGTGTYTVVLDTQPTSTVAVTINDPTDNADVTASPSSLTFFASNWNTAQTVTVSAAEDSDSAQDTATVTHTVAGADYGSVSASNVGVTVTDNDTPGVAVTPLSLTIGEGSTGTYTVKLNTQPSGGNVTVAISSDNGDVTTSSSSLTFTTSNWSAEQTVTVTAGQDADAADDTAILTLDPSGGGYNSVSDVDVTVTVTDDETRGVTVTPTALTIEEGDSGMYTVVLLSEPTATVTIGVGDDSSGVSVSPRNLTFTTSTWSMAQTVTVTSTEDNVDEADQTATVMHDVSGGDYGSETADDVTVTVEDDDTRGVTVSKSSLTFEEGDSGTYTVELGSAPTANVTITVSSDTTGVTVSPSSLTFTAGNWNSAKTVTVSSTEDRIDEPDQNAMVTHMVSGGDYGSVSATGVTVTVTDDDTRDLILSPASLTVAEGDRETYTVKLDSQPTAEVTVGISSDITDVSVNPATLTFTTGNWASAQTVTATAHEDNIDEGAGVMASLTHNADGGDYGSESDSLTVTVTDDDTREVIVSESSLTIEEGESDTYTVKLMSAPTSDVTIGVSPGSGVSVSSSNLTFTDSDWSAAQTVTVSATDNDIDEANRTVSVTHSVGGGDYGSQLRDRRQRRRYGRGQRHARRNGLAHVADGQRGRLRDVHRRAGVRTHERRDGHRRRSERPHGRDGESREPEFLHYELGYCADCHGFGG